MINKILIAGYPYIRESYNKTFDLYPIKDEIVFLLPRAWPIKKGKAVYHPLKNKNTYIAKAYFNHSHYFLIGGLLKGWMPVFPLILLKLRRRKSISLVYSPSEPILLTTLYQAFWSKLFGLKHVFFTWENISYEDKFKGSNLLLKKIIIKLNLLLSDGIICGNHKAEHIFKQLTEKPIAVIPLSGVDVDFFHKVNAESFLETYHLKDKFIFSFAGAIGHRKGIHNMVNAFKSVITFVPKAHLVIAGSGEYEEETSRLIVGLGLQEHTTIISWLDSVGLRELLSSSHVFLYPSISYGGWEEQFGYSMAEASLMELPVISTRSGSIEEVIINGKTGIIVSPDNVEELSVAMVKLANDPELRKKMGKEGRNHVTKNFSYQVIAEKFYNFFKKI